MTLISRVSPAWARVLPFSAYVVFLGGVAILGSVAEVLPGLNAWMPAIELWHYPAKILAVAMLLIVLWPQYEELDVKALRPIQDFGLAGLAGVFVYVIWVRLDWSWAVLGTPVGYNPFAGGEHGWLLGGIRLIGAATIVPIMEELFWRSFLVRYLISSRFRSVPIGAFAPIPWMITILLFGFEHHLWLAGIFAALVYTLLCYYSRRLWPAVIAHGVTNLCLGIHVLVTKEWFWW